MKITIACAIGIVLFAANASAQPAPTIKQAIHAGQCGAPVKGPADAML